MRTDAQLQDLFDECCHLLPAAVSSKIRHMWQDEKLAHEVPAQFRPLLIKVPTITELSDSGEPIEMPSKTALTDGIRFWFKAIVVDEAPDEVLRTIIVHELGHALRAAEWLAITGERPARNRDIEEAAANSLCGEMDFDLEATWTWLRENRLHLGLADS